jgi:hypothetical protein
MKDDRTPPALALIAAAAVTMAAVYCALIFFFSL